MYFVRDLFLKEQVKESNKTFKSYKVLSLNKNVCFIIAWLNTYNIFIWSVFLT